MNKKFIYKVTNKLNGKCYIGQTSDIKRRFCEHKALGYKEEEKGKALYVAFNKYGIDNFSFEVIDYCEDYNDKERFYIDLYNSYKNGYNMTLGGEEPPINKGENSPFRLYDVSVNLKIKRLLKETSLDQKDIAEIIGCNPTTVHRINHGVLWREDDRKYPIRTTNLETFVINQIQYELLNTSKTQKEIGSYYNVARTTITAINRGQNHYNENFEYPLRKSRRGLKG